MKILTLTSLASLSTVLGGWLALRARKHIHLLLGFGAGVLLGATFFDLLPEAIQAASARGLDQPGSTGTDSRRFSGVLSGPESPHAASMPTRQLRGRGILNIALFFQVRSIQGSGWLLIDGIITLLLGLMIYMQWPSSSAWAIGTLVGVSMIISGVTRVMLSLAVRKVADTISSKLAA
jgi:hypothetical protein